MSVKLTPENYKRYYEWDTLPYEIRTVTIEKLSDRLKLDELLVTELEKVIKADQNWWCHVSEEFEKETKQFLTHRVAARSWDDYWAAAIEKSIEKIVESAEYDKT